MQPFLTKLLPVHPSPLYLFIRNILVIGLCLYLMVLSLNTWIQYLLEPPVPPLIHKQAKGDSRTSQSHETQRTSPKSAVNVQAIVQRNIFGGSPDEPAKEEEPQNIELDKIPLAENLKEYQLIGTIVTSEGKNWAVIENMKDRQQKMYTLGDPIKDARIKQILRNNVVINNGKEDRMLSIDYKIRTRIQGSTFATEGKGLDSEKVIPPIPLSRTKVENAMSDFNKILQQARIRPYEHKGKSVGMQVSQIQDQSFLQTLRLKDGDVLIKTEHADLNTPQGLYHLFQEIKDNDLLELHIQRGGQDMALRYELQ